VSVIFHEVTKYDAEKIRLSVIQAFEELNLDLRGKQSAFLKVNIVRPTGPESGVVTHPVVVEALVSALREHGVREITIGEGSAAGVDTEKAFGKAGYLDLARRMGVRLLDINHARTVQKPWDFGMLELPADLVESDLYVNVAKMKTHFHTVVTLSMKNQQGLLTWAAKKANHRDRDLFESLVSIAKVIQPDLIVVDAIDAMEGEGPTQGKKKHTAVMVYGDDMVETDTACCQFMGVSPSSIRMLQSARNQEFGRREIEIKGEAFASRKTSFILPSPKPKKVLNFYSWKNYRACAENEHSFEEAIHLALRSPRYWFTFFPKFARFVLFGRFHLLRGKNADLPREPGRVLCVGDCCEEVARENDACFVAGCPPKPEDILEAVRRMK
jgi:uncharacterized protein (DUF362 family)